MQSLGESDNLELAGIVIGIVIVLVVILTLVLRRIDSTYAEHWHHGLADSLYHVVSVVTTGKSNYKGSVGVAGRLLATLWLFCGVSMVAYFTSTVTSEMTANKLRNEISGPSDLPGKRVGVITATASAEYAMGQGWQTQGFEDLPSAVTALVDRDIEAIVFDAPVLLYYDHAHPELPLAEVGAIFDPVRYAFALPIGSTHRARFNVALLELEESGAAARMSAKYFGKD